MHIVMCCGFARNEIGNSLAPHGDGVALPKCDRAQEFGQFSPDICEVALRKYPGFS